MPNAGGLVCAIELEPSVRYPTLNIDSGRGCEARTKKRPGMAVPGRVSLGALSVCSPRGATGNTLIIQQLAWRSGG